MLGPGYSKVTLIRGFMCGAGNDLRRLDYIKIVGNTYQERTLICHIFLISYILFIYSGSQSRKCFRLAKVVFLNY